MPTGQPLPLTPERLAEARAAGLTAAQLCRSLGLSARQVAGWLSRNGRSYPGMPSRPSGAAVARLQEKIDEIDVRGGVDPQATVAALPPIPETTAVHDPKCPTVAERRSDAAEGAPGANPGTLPESVAPQGFERVWAATAQDVDDFLTRNPTWAVRSAPLPGGPIPDPWPQAASGTNGYAQVDPADMQLVQQQPVMVYAPLPAAPLPGPSPTGPAPVDPLPPPASPFRSTDRKGGIVLPVRVDGARLLVGDIEVDGDITDVEAEVVLQWLAGRLPDRNWVAVTLEGAGERGASCTRG